MEQRDNQEATAVIQVLDKIGLTSLVAVKIMVNGQILTVWMWVQFGCGYDERETEERVRFFT